MKNVTTQFMMEEVIDPEKGTYRETNIMTDPNAGVAPNWFVMFKMQNCYFCDQIEPAVHAVARAFHKEGFPRNYRVAIVDCSREDSVYMCEYLHITKLPKFIVFRPDAGENKFYQFPLAYRKNFNNFMRFAIQEWPQAYT